MKNLKKVLALAVAFVMCFTMFAGAAVFSDVPVGGNYSEAITFLSDLQIIAGKPDGTFGVNDAITRADAACLIARMMTGQQNPPKYDNHVAFSDVPVGSYYEAAVGYCAALGVTSGTGGGKFSPMKTITDGEFVAMLTRALGYDTPENPLQFPMGNITVAQAKGLLDGVSINYMSDALRGEDAQMLFNAVFADYDRAAKNKNVFQASDDHYTVTIAEEVFDLGRLSHDDAESRAESIAFHGSSATKNPAKKCDVHTWVIAGVDARTRENTYVAFAIDDSNEKAISPEKKSWAYQEFSYDGDIEKLLGYRVELWGEMDHSNAVWDVSAIKVLDGQSSYNYHAGLYTDKEKVKIDDTTLNVDKNKNQVNLANINLQQDEWSTRDIEDKKDKNTYQNNADEKGLVARDHGDAYTLATVKADLKMSTQDTVYLNFADGDQYKLIDWDTDGNLDFVVRDTYKYAEVKTVSKSRLVLTAEDGKAPLGRGVGDYVLKLDDDNLKVTGADGLSEGDIVEISVTSRVYDKSEGGEVVTINLEALDAESKTLEKINMTNDTYTFDGEELTFADPDLFDLVDEEQTSRDEMRTKENVGQAFNIFFDKSGFMIKGNVADDSARGYLMILDTVDGNGNLNSNSKRGLAAIDVLFDDNTVQDEVPVVKDLKIKLAGDNERYEDKNGYTKSSRKWDQVKVVGNVYKYYMNKDGEITRLEEMTEHQRSDYSFDDSKDRISIMNENADKYTSYTFASDAPIFAVRNINDAALDGPNKTGKGYVRVIQDKHTADVGDNEDVEIVHATRYYVDSADVVVVNVDDMPEVDNRRAVVTANSGWHGSTLWKDNDVTHPDKLLDGTKSAGFAAQTNSWIENNVSYFNDWATFDTVGTNEMKVPTIAFSLNSKDEVKTAVIGVDTLDYFGASNVKLALLTDIYYHGNDVYSIDAAIDGKVANYKTIAADESDLFTDRDYESIQSYLDLDEDYARGARNGLYAEVNMNSDGLITKVRSMDLTPVSTWSGDEKIQSTTVAEGNVYRVIRGVVTQVRPGSKNTLVTWQTSPIASNRDKYRLYDLSEFEDHNLFDHLEATYDSDTFFYKVTEKLTLTNGQPVTIKTAFKDDLGLKEADSTDLVESVFPGKATDPKSKQGSAVYYLADFAVKKAASDELVAVVAFTEELTNEGVLSDEKLGLTIGGETAKKVPIAAGESQRFALAIIGDGDLKDVEIKKDADPDTAYVAGSIGVTDGNITAKTVDNRYLDIVVDPAAATTDSAKFTVRVKGLPVATIEVTADGAASVKGFFVEVVKNTKDIKVSLSTNDENGPLVSASDIKEQGLSVTATVKKNGSDVKVKLYDIEADASGDGYFVLRPTDENAKNWEMSDVVEITVSLDGTELGTLENYKVGYNDVEYVAK